MLNICRMRPLPDACNSRLLSKVCLLLHVASLMLTYLCMLQYRLGLDVVNSELC